MNLRRNPQPGELTLLPYAALGRWAEEAPGSHFAHVQALVPGGYAAYARLFHPALTQEGRPVVGLQSLNEAARRITA